MGPCTGRVSSLTGVVSPVLVPNGGDHEGAPPGAEGRGDDAQVLGQGVPVEGPPDGQWFVALRDDARHLGKPPLIENRLAKRQGKDDWRNWKSNS